jgi:HAD superfamily phosphoserine phosphatase-like hydrolase
MNMSIRALLLDFDGTLVQRDMLSEAIGLVGKKAESEAIDADFQAGKLSGVLALVKRINLLNGVTIERIQRKVRENLALMDGARELLSYCKAHDILTILASGSITPILAIYQEALGIDHIIGPEPQIKNNTIIGISDDDFPKEGHFKVVGISRILAERNIAESECVAIGDSRGDLAMFELANFAIAIKPKVNLDDFVDAHVENLHEVIEILEGLHSYSPVLQKA